MNERIKELIIQTHHFDDLEDIDGQQVKIYGFTRDGIERFAELLVQQCLDICYEAEYDGERIAFAAEQIAERFGVE